MDDFADNGVDHRFFAEENTDTFNVIGKGLQRLDTRAHVTGRTRFIEDQQFPNLLHIKMCRSTRHHALIRSIDTSAAEAFPGVHRVLMAKDVPNNWYTVLRLINVGPDDEPVLAEDRVLYKGEPICAVVAETEAAAREAASMVDVVYEDLPAVLDVEEALKPGAQLVNPKHGKNYFEYEGHHCRRVRFGDVDAGLAESDHVIERRYQSSPIEHAPVETNGCIVVPDGNGRLVIHSNTQACYFTLDNLALTLDVPTQKLRVIGGTVGGGFGGKVDVMVEPLACISAMLTGRPTKFVYDREEEMQVSSTRGSELVIIKDGVTDDGLLLARKVTLYLDAGAYSRHTPYGVTKASAHMPGPYTIPNVWIDCHHVYTNRTPASAMRGFGVTIGDFALESQMDQVAHSIGMDPLDFRLTNAYRDGDIKAHQKAVEGAALVEVMLRAAELSDHELPRNCLVMSSTHREGL